MRPVLLPLWEIERSETHRVERSVQTDAPRRERPLVWAKSVGGQVENPARGGREGVTVCVRTSKTPTRTGARLLGPDTT